MTARDDYPLATHEWQSVDVINRALDEIDRLRAALTRAHEDMKGWAGYASEYFTEKWDLAGDLAAIDEALGR